ncbi:MAG TPA: hypothetical protein VG498_00885 [Terriglobales bacterium]|nr:hypothetical protein [Terriglobales bacterium]
MWLRSMELRQRSHRESPEARTKGAAQIPRLEEIKVTAKASRAPGSAAKGTRAAEVHARLNGSPARAAVLAGARSPVLLKTTLQVSGIIRRGERYRP